MKKKLISIKKNKAYIKYSERFSYVTHLLYHSCTGSPGALAHRLNISEETLRNMINQLRQEGYNIKYCSIRKSYVLG